mgnify:CR=1 FL=1
MGQKTRKQLEIEKVTSALYSQGTRQTASSEQQRNTAKQSAIQNFTQSINSQADAWSKNHIQSAPKSRDVRSYNPSGTPALQKPKTESANVETVNFTSRKSAETSRSGQSWKERQERLTGKQTAYQMQKESGISPDTEASKKTQTNPEWENNLIAQATTLPSAPELTQADVEKEQKKSSRIQKPTADHYDAEQIRQYKEQEIGDYKKVLDEQNTLADTLYKEFQTAEQAVKDAESAYEKNPNGVTRMRYLKAFDTYQKAREPLSTAVKRSEELANEVNAMIGSYQNQYDDNTRYAGKNYAGMQAYITELADRLDQTGPEEKNAETGQNLREQYQEEIDRATNYSYSMMDMEQLQAEYDRLNRQREELYKPVGPQYRYQATGADRQAAEDRKAEQEKTGEKMRLVQKAMNAREADDAKAAYESYAAGKAEKPTVDLAGQNLIDVFEEMVNGRKGYKTAGETTEIALRDQVERNMKHLPENAKEVMLQFLEDKDYVSAANYYKAYESTMTANYANAQYAELKDWASQNFGTALGGSIGAGVAGAVTPAGAWIDNTFNAINNKLVDVTGEGEYRFSDVNSDMYRGARTAAALQEGVQAYNATTGEWEDALNLASGALTSSVQNVVQFALFGSASLPFMAASAAGQSAYQGLKSGLSEEQAAVTSTVSGLIEYMTEKLPLEHLLNKINTIGEGGVVTVKQIAEMIRKQGLEEASEEVVGNIADNLFDMWYNKDNSEFRQYSAQLQREGMSKAEADMEAFGKFFVGDSIEAAAAAYLSTFLLIGGNVASANMQAAQYGKEMKAGEAFKGTQYTVDEMNTVLLAQQIPGEYEGGRYAAEQLKNQVLEGKRLSNRMLGFAAMTNNQVIKDASKYLNQALEMGPETQSFKMAAAMVGQYDVGSQLPSKAFVESLKSQIEADKEAAKQPKTKAKSAQTTTGETLSHYQTIFAENGVGIRDAKNRTEVMNKLILGQSVSDAELRKLHMGAKLTKQMLYELTGVEIPEGVVKEKDLMQYYRIARDGFEAKIKAEAQERTAQDEQAAAEQQRAFEAEQMRQMDIADRVVEATKSDVDERLQYFIEHGKLKETEKGAENGQTGEAVLRGTGGRVDGQSDGGTDAAAAGNAEADTRGTEGQNRSGDAGVSEEVRVRGRGNAVSSRDFGLKNATTLKTAREVLQEDETEPMRKFREDVKAKYGYDVVYTDGDFVQRQDGRDVIVRGLFDQESKRLFVNANYFRLSYDQIGNHEVFHIEVSNGDVDLQAMAEAFNEATGNKEILDSLVNQYMEKLALDDYNSALEEVFADMNGKFNGIRSVNVTAYQDIFEQIKAASPKNGEAASSMPKFSVETAEDGQKYVLIDQQQGRFIGLNSKEAARLAKDIIQEEFSGQTLPLGEYAATTVRRQDGWSSHQSGDRYDGASKYAYDGRQYSDTVFQAKMRAAANLDEMLEASEYVGHSNDRKNHTFATDGFDYYKTTFVVGGRTFEGTFNIGLSDMGATFYGMTKIEQVAVTGTLASVLVTDAQPDYGDLRNSRIARNDETVKQKNSEVVDSDGKNLSERQQEFFSESKARDPEGRLLALYRGHRRGSTVYSADYRGAIWSTTDKAYAETYGNVDEVYANIKNPYELTVKVGRDSKGYDIDEAISNAKAGNHDGAIITFEYDFNNDPMSYDNWMAQNAPNKPADEVVRFASVRPGETIGEFMDRAKAGPLEKHVVVWDSSQFKSAENFTPTQGKDIRYSQETDEEYRRLAEQPRENRAELQKMVDAAASEAGYTKKAYHGTDGDFWTFSLRNRGKNGEMLGVGYYFAENEGDAAGYARGGGKVLPVYLDIQNPVSTTKLTITPEQWGAFLDYAQEHRNEYIDGVWKGNSIKKDFELRYMNDYDSDTDLISGFINATAGRNSEVAEAYLQMLKDSTGIDGAIQGEDGRQVYVAFTPEQIKSAEPVTRNDSGDVIPLSERFNASKGDIRYSFASVEDNQVIRKAEQMESDGKTPEEIWRALGVARTMDGKGWRYEIDDSTVKLKNEMLYDYQAELRDQNRAWEKLTDRALSDEQVHDLADYMKGAIEDRHDEKLYDKLENEFGGDFIKWADALENVKEAKKVPRNGASLEEFIDAAELFAAYPQLRDTRLVFQNLDSGENGYYDRQRDIIVLSERLRRKSESTLLHEIQHVIQGIDKTPGGASPGYWKRRMEEGYSRRENDGRIAKAEKEYQRIFDSASETFKNKVREINRARLAQDYDAAEAIVDELYDSEYAELWSQLDMADFERRNERGNELRPSDLYRNTAGEIEARDTAARRSLTAEERRNLMPKTADENTVFVEQRYSIDSDMTEDERYRELRGKTVAVTPEAKYTDEQLASIHTLEQLNAKAKSKAEKVIRPLAESLGILNRSMKTPDVEIEFTFSKNKGLRESMSKQLRYGGTYADFAKALVNLDGILENAVLIEQHKDKYAGTVRENPYLNSVSVLVGVFHDGDSLIPTQIEIKDTADAGGTLYMTVAMTKIETGVLGSTMNQNGTSRSLIPISSYNLAEIFANVNPADGHFLKYVPDGFLNDAQKAAKQSAIREDANRIQSYRQKNSVDTDLMDVWREQNPGQTAVTQEGFDKAQRTLLDRYRNDTVLKTAYDSVGAAKNANETQTKTSKARTNTFEKLFSEAEKGMEGLREEDMTYDVIREKESLEGAAARLAQDFDGEVDDLLKRTDWTGEDLDTAMGALSVFREEAQKSGDYSKVVEMAQKIRENATKGGQFVQAFAKYNRTTPEGLLVKAIDEVDKAKNPVQRKNVNPIAQTMIDSYTEQIRDLRAEQKQAVQDAKLAGQMGQGKADAAELRKIRERYENQIKELNKQRDALLADAVLAGQMSQGRQDAAAMRRITDAYNKRIEQWQKKIDLAKAAYDEMFQKGQTQQQQTDARAQERKIQKFEDMLAKLQAERDEILNGGLDALRATNKGISDAKANEITKNLTEMADALDAVKEGDVDALIDVIRRQAKIRKTPVSNATLNNLKKQNFEWLWNAASTQYLQIAKDYVKPSMARRVATFQTMSHLFNMRTGMRNVVSNLAFSAVEAAANDISQIPDMVLGAITGKRGVGFDQAVFSKANWEGFMEGYSKVQPELALDIETAENGKYGTGRRTNKMTGNLLTRNLSRVERLMGYELNLTDEVTKGSIRAETLRQLQGFVDSGKMTMEEAIQAAEQEMLYRTFQDDTLVGNALSVLKKLGNTFIGFGDSGQTLGKMKVHEFGLGDLLTKYTQVPGALVHRSIEFTPAGYAKAIYALVMAQKNGGIKNMSALQQRNIALAIGRATTGTGLIALFAALTKAGIILNADDEDDPDAKALRAAGGISGTQINVDALGRLIRGESADIQDGDELWGIEFMQPVNGSMTIGALLNNSKEGQNLAQRWLEAILHGTVQSIDDLSVMNTLRTIQNAIDYSQEDTLVGQAWDAVIELAKSSATGFIPSPVRQFAQGMDAYYRDAYGSKNLLTQGKEQVMNAIPGLRQNLPTKLTNFGEDKTYGGSTVQRWMNAFFTPGSVRTYQADDTVQELLNLYYASGNEKIIPAKSAPYKIQVGNERYEMSAEERREYQTTMGQTAKLWMEQFFDSEDYAGMTTEERAAQVEKIVKSAEDVAKNKVAGAMGIDNAKVFDQGITVETTRLGLAGESGVSPSLPDSKSIGDPDRTGYKYELTNEELKQWEDLYNGAYTKEVGDVIQSDAYAKADDAEKADMIRDAKETAKNAAKDEFLEALQSVGIRAELDESSDFYEIRKNVTEGTSIEKTVKRLKSDGVSENSISSAITSTIKDGYLNGDFNEKTANKKLVQYGAAKDENDAYWKIREWEGGEDYKKYDRFYASVENGKKLDDTISYYTSHGVESKTLKSQITSHFKPLYLSASVQERQYMKEYLLDAYEALGVSRNKAAKNIDKWLEE